MSRPVNREFAERLGRIEETTRAIEASADAATREQVRELARAILELHQAGLARLLELIRCAGQSGEEILDLCAGDDLVRSMLLLHDLHPQRLEARLRLALAQLEAVLLQHGVTLRLIDADDETARLGIHGAPLTPFLRNLVDGAIREAAPDLERIEFEASRPPDTIPLPLLEPKSGGRR